MPQPPLRALRLANPVVRAVLDSRAHPILSGALVVLAYRGRRSERAFRIPLRYAEMRDGRIVVLAAAPERKLWWRSFADPASGMFTLRGERVEVRGVLVAGEERERAVAAYVARFPRSARLAHQAAIVVFTPTPR